MDTQNTGIEIVQFHGSLHFLVKKPKGLSIYISKYCDIKGTHNLSLFNKYDYVTMKYILWTFRSNFYCNFHVEKTSRNPTSVLYIQAER